MQAEERDINLVGSNSLPESTLLLGDSGRLRQVLTNLLSNSIKFTRRSFVTLSVRQIPNETVLELTSTLTPAVGASEQMTLEFVVKDTGLVIRKENLQKLFKPFSQTDSTTARMHGGTGLGPSISRAYGRAHSLGIRAVSEYDCYGLDSLPLFDAQRQGPGTQQCIWRHKSYCCKQRTRNERHYEAGLCEEAIVNSHSSGQEQRYQSENCGHKYSQARLLCFCRMERTRSLGLS